MTDGLLCRAAAAAAVLSLCRARALTQGHAQRLLVLAAGTWSADVDASVADVHISNMLMLASHIWPPEVCCSSRSFTGAVVGSYVLQRILYEAYLPLQLAVEVAEKCTRSAW